MLRRWSPASAMKPSSGRTMETEAGDGLSVRLWLARLVHRRSVTKDLVPVVVAAVAIFGVLLIKCFDIAMEASRRTWDDRQKNRLKRQEAAAAFLRAVVEATEEISSCQRPANVRSAVHIALLQMQAVGAGKEVVEVGLAILRKLGDASTDTALDSDGIRELLSSAGRRDATGTPGFVELAERDFVSDR
jgi:hypothetical protein